MRIPPPTKLLILLGVCLGLAAAAPAQAPPGGPTIILAEMDQRDWLNSLTTTNSFRAPNPNPAVEWDMTEEGETVSHAAYVKGSGVTVKIRLANKTGNRVAGSFTIQGARLKVPGPSAVGPGPYYISLSASPSSFSFSLAPTTKFSQEIAISGLPSHVAVGAFEVKYAIQAAEYSPDDEILRTSTIGTNGTFQAWERICILDATPIGLQSVPWTDFLEYSCRWAYGANGAHGVKEEMTKGIHFGRYSPNNRLQYDPGVNYYWSVPKFATNSVPYLLSFLLWELGSPLGQYYPNWIQLDRSDINGLLMLALSSQGTVSHCIVVMGQYTPEYPSTGYFYWPLCKAGNDPAVTWPILEDGYRAGNYRSSGFNFHLLVESEAKRYDSAASYYYKHDGSLWHLPVFHWDAATYWQSYGLFRTGHAFSRQAPFNWLFIPFGVGNESVPLLDINYIQPSQVL